MPDTPAVDAPASAAPLSGIACCEGLPEREGLGPPLEAELEDGHVLDGRFVIREAIGRSAMATIYRAEDREAGGASVAVKVPLARVQSDPAQFGRFQREERIVASLDCPGVLRFVAAPKGRSRPYFVTGYLDGCTLALVIHRSRPIPEHDALRIAGALCQALGPMHDAGIVHGDLKPANVMICRDHTLCVMDFGLASEIESGSGILGSLMPLFGTPEYMAPEQVRNKRCDARTDVYCVGVILYQMLTGALPFTHEDPWEAAQRRVSGDPPAPRALNPSISAQAEEIVLRAMRRDPEERYQSAREMKKDLDSPQRVQVTGLRDRLQAPRWRLSLQGTPLAAGALIGAGSLLALVGLFFLLMRLH
jgi:serine/threonine-protein kinase